MIRAIRTSWERVVPTSLAGILGDRLTPVPTIFSRTELVESELMLLELAHTNPI